jgi:hypothetical protein
MDDRPWAPLPHGTVRAMCVVVLKVFGENGLEVTTTENQHLVETLTAQGADQPFADGIGTRCPDGVFTIRMRSARKTSSKELGNFDHAHVILPRPAH